MVCPKEYLFSSNSYSWEKYTKINGKTKLAGGSKYHCFSLPLEFCVFAFMKIQANFENKLCEGREQFL